MSNLGVFKNAIKKNVGTGASSTIYTAPAGDSYVIECDIACTGNTGVQISVSVVDSSANVEAYLVRKAPVPIGSSIQVIDGQKIVLEQGDSIKVTCDTAGETVDVVMSVVENVNFGA